MCGVLGVLNIWIDYPPLRQAKSKYLFDDVLAHTMQDYNSSDKVEICHEQSHQVHAEIRNKYGAGYNAFYVFNNKACVLKEPGHTMQDADRILPASQRGKYTYSLYMVQQAQHWGDRLLYIFDEWVCYCNGASAGLELFPTDGSQNQGSYQVECALEFFPYVMAACYLVPEEKEIQEFVQFNTTRLAGLVSLAEKVQPNRTDKHQGLIRSFETASDNQQLRDFARNYLDSVEYLPDYGGGTYL